MKEVTIVGYCDGEHEEKTRSQVERTVAVDGSKPVTLDLCNGCDGAIRDLLHLMEHGAVVGAKSKKRGPYGPRAAAPRATAPAAPAVVAVPTGQAPPLEGPHICPECAFESRSRGALGQHLNTTHDKGFRDYANAS